MEIPKEVLDGLDLKPNRRVTKRRRWLERDPNKYQRTLGIFKQHFPHLFLEMKPLARDISTRIKENLPDLKSRDISHVLYRYCKQKKYLELLITSDERYNLQGEVDGNITVNEKVRAKKQLDELG